ncbi:hypothetical protein G6F16_006870 [Rhizopus arrhizus]|uniref:Uncharacterized protein n=1 Tax=Rhizopus oryzae TaxID=64495 RepID=A0A9P6X7U4_RHIOR|nr:hypothetical protein G6F21_006899 [Rhizopus arrhizus]KAG0800845.1 hypothetical protein G6F22_001825 [Rhizopus arrhizus]KAG0812400.1 hypothetical protein G6F20_006392 [Rhizopus arrhizus]KAG0832020.1 hypothetical protein G6F19_006436 [Rhizopus arrhizus]KAG0833949.1 hypothetical protein G6F18_006538 [Rhizopus arrhizus]
MASSAYNNQNQQQQQPQQPNMMPYNPSLVGMDHTYFYQQPQLQPTNVQQMQQLNHLRTNNNFSQQQQQVSYSSIAYNNYPQQPRPPLPQQQQMSPVVMNSLLANSNPSLIYQQQHSLLNQVPQAVRQSTQQFYPQQLPGFIQPYTQQQLSPQAMQAYQQELQRQQLQRQQYLLQQQQYRQQQQYIQQQRAMTEMNARPKRPTRAATKKKRAYEESSEEEDFAITSDEEEVPIESDEDSERNRKSQSASVDPDEPVMIPLGTKSFERILDYRRNNETGEEELLIKYKNTSFLHVEWVPLENIENEHLGKHRVKKFMQKYHEEGGKGEDFQEYIKIDRVIDDGELEDPVTGENKIYYLVKWNGLFYDLATWETEEDVRRVDNVKLEEFIARKQIPAHKLAPSAARPDVTRFIQYDSSPVYKYNNSLRTYQLEGLNWLRYCYYSFRSCILADEMGLGKTVQSVALLNDIYHHIGIRGPFLIIAPLSTIPHWTRAFGAWTDLNIVDFRGSHTARSLIIETEFNYLDMEGNPIPGKYKFDVLITTYETASASAATLKDIPWRCGVFDEAHRLKNKNSKVLEVLRTFYIDHKLLLTGTPLQNNLGELYSLLHFMAPHIYDDEKYFFSEYGNLNSAHEVEKLQALLKPIMLRRFKEDVEKTIPVKEETVIEVELTNPQKKWYRAILEKNFTFLKRGSKNNKDMPHLRNIMMQLRKCCIHPYLLEGAEEVIVSECNARGSQEQFNCLVQSSGKLVLIDKLLRKLILGNHKVLIFSQFTSCLDILADYLRGRKYAYERIDGSIPGEQRQAAIDRFSTLPIEESFVFLLCTRAGGVGINLTAADTCIIFDSDWNPQNDLQAQARCHRIGQTKPVQIYRLICANTYEKDMFDRAGMKLGLDKAVMGTHDDGNTNKTSELNRQEIEDLLKKGAYGAMLNDEESAKFCEEDIDQILERRTKVIRHEGNEKGSVFSKATFSAADDDNLGVDLDDPDFWEKWAAKAQIDTSEKPDENTLIIKHSRRRRQVQRFGSRNGDGFYSSENDSDAAYEDESDLKSSRRGRGEQPRPWTLSEKTKYERKLMIYGYGSWDLMVIHFPRRSEKDLRAVTRALMRKALPAIDKKNEEDRKLIEDIQEILVNDSRDEARKYDSVPYIGATKKQITEYRSFLSPPDYADHIERKGRNFLLRIQMLQIIREKIVPNDWEEAKKLEIPRVTGSPPASWWKSDEDRDLLLGILKHGYQQYLSIRSDPEFCFYGKKYDDSQTDGGEDDEPKNDQALETEEKKPITFGTKDEDSDYEDKNNGNETDEEEYIDSSKSEVYIWPSKADIGMRLRRIIAAFLRERVTTTRRRRARDGSTRSRQRQPAQKQRSQGTGRRSKKRKVDIEQDEEIKGLITEQSVEQSNEQSAENNNELLPLDDTSLEKRPETLSGYQVGACLAGNVEEAAMTERHLLTSEKEPPQVYTKELNTTEVPLMGTIEQPLSEKKEETVHLGLKEGPVTTLAAEPSPVDQNVAHINTKEQEEVASEAVSTTNVLN